MRPRADLQIRKESGFERTRDYVIACHSLRGKVSQLQMVEDFDSRPHKAESFVGRERQGDKGMK